MKADTAVHWLKRIGVVLIIATALVHLGFRIHFITDHRENLGGAEVNVVYGVQKMLLGRPLYEDPEKSPYDVMQYTPAYYGVCAALAIVLPIDPHDSYALFLLSRIVSLILNLFTCLGIFRLCKLLQVEVWIALAVAAIGFTLFTEHFYSRVDSLYAPLFIWTLIRYVRWTRQEGSMSALVVVALLAVLSICSKQTGILLIGIIGVHLLVTKQWRAFFTFSGAVALILAIFLLSVFLNTSPEVFFKNTVQGIANGIGGNMYTELLPFGIYKYYVGWHIAAIALVVVFLRDGDRVDRFLAVSIATATAFGLITGLKNASNINYLFEAHLLVVIGASRWLCTRVAPWQLQLSGLFLLYGLLFTVHRTRVLNKLVGTAEQRAHREHLHNADEHTRAVLVNELGLRPEEKVLITYHGHLELLLNGQGLLAQKDILEWSVEPLFNYDAVAKSLADGTVRYVISDVPMDTLRFLGRSYPQFHEVREVDGRHILAPAPH
ncbi:MAG: hypothetical protein IPG92_11825 [Flavobacteriales bacterium]|nr:hypothetical protein [Flavobacteriales bacterium]